LEAAKIPKSEEFSNEEIAGFIEEYSKDKVPKKEDFQVLPPTQGLLSSDSNPLFLQN
jgi:hypothetical protein